MAFSIAGGVTALIWLYLVLGRGGFWRVRDAEAAPVAPAIPRRTAVVIPARNEAEFVARAIASLARQANPGGLHIFLVDDHSTDGTADRALAAAHEAGVSGILTVIRATPLPDGWTGKLWAVSEGLKQAAAVAPDYFLLTDADIVHAPDSVARLVARAESGGHALVSLMVRLHCESVAERMLIPAFVFFFFKLYPPSWIANPRYGTAGAAGGCLLIRRGALDSIGGIARIRSEVIDDCALARAVKRAGGSVWLGAASATCSVRPYPGFAGIGRMISRTAFAQLGHSGFLLAAAVAGMFLVYLAPPLLAWTGDPWAGLAWALMTLAYIPMVRFYKLSPLWALLLPAAGLFYTAATVHSAVSYWLGRGGEWKGRAQDRRG